jgi:hypothetical protein
VGVLAHCVGAKLADSRTKIDANGTLIDFVAHDGVVCVGGRGESVVERGWR